MALTFDGTQLVDSGSNAQMSPTATAIPNYSPTGTVPAGPPTGTPSPTGGGQGPAPQDGGAMQLISGLLSGLFKGGGGGANGGLQLSTGPMSGFSNMMQGLNYGAAGLADIGAIYQGMQAHKIAKDNLSFQKDFARENMDNQRQVTNNAIRDRENARRIQTGRSDGTMDEFMQKYGV